VVFAACAQGLTGSTHTTHTRTQPRNRHHTAYGPSPGQPPRRRHWGDFRRHRMRAAGHDPKLYALTFVEYHGILTVFSQPISGVWSMSKAPRVALQAAWDDVGGLSKPSKMPGWSTSIPASRCIVGSALRLVSGSVCADCYALKGRYVFPDVQSALERRYARLDSPTWVKSMATLINALCVRVPYFRWFDSGDIQSVAHLARIIEVVRRTPTVAHWLPTREYKTVLRTLGQSSIASDGTIATGTDNLPSNLTIRLSAHMVDGLPPIGIGRWWLPVSTVHTDALPRGIGSVPSPLVDGATLCEAPSRGGHCGDCRMCWNPTVAWVSYHKH